MPGERQDRRLACGGANGGVQGPEECHHDSQQDCGGGNGFGASSDRDVQEHRGQFARSPIRTKTERLQGAEYTAPVHFVDGTEVTQVEKAKCLGSQLSWHSPIKAALDAKKALAHSSCMKLQPLWRSKPSWKTKVRIYQTSIVPSPLYGPDALILQVRHLKTIDAC